MPGAERDWERRIGGRLKLRDLHILSMVVQWGSMAKAATHLAMSQPAVSEAIANLEAALKVNLLDRNVRGVEPTIYATALLKRERAVFDELQQGIKEIAFLANPTAGEVRLATTEVLACGLVPHVIERLSRRYPQILIHAVVADTTTLEFRELRERRVDILLARVPEATVDEDIDLDIFHEDAHFVVAGAQSPWARRRNVTLAELMDEPWVFPYAQVVRGTHYGSVPRPWSIATAGTGHLGHAASAKTFADNGTLSDNHVQLRPTIQRRTMGGESAADRLADKAAAARNFAAEETHPQSGGPTFHRRTESRGWHRA